MSKSFKIIVSTFSSIISLGFFVLAGFMMFFGAEFSPEFVLPLLGVALFSVITIIFYILFIKDNKDVFFWLSLIPLLLAVVVVPLLLIFKVQF